MASSSKRIYLSSDVQPLLFGQHGLRFLTTGTSSAGEFYAAIFANEDAVINATSAREGTTTISGMKIPAGSIIYGCFTLVTVVSGSVTCYLTENIP